MTGAMEEYILNSLPTTNGKSGGGEKWKFEGEMKDANDPTLVGSFCMIEKGENTVF
jgi:hypothetical protein